MSLSQTTLPYLLNWRNHSENESLPERQFRKVTAEIALIATTVIAAIETLGCGAIGQVSRFYYPDTAFENWMFTQSELGVKSLLSGIIFLATNFFSEKLTIEKTEACYRILIDGIPLELGERGIKGTEFYSLIKKLLKPLENYQEIITQIKNEDYEIHEPLNFMLVYYYYKTRIPFEGLSPKTIEEVDELNEIPIDLEPHQVFVLKKEGALDSHPKYKELFQALGKIATSEIYGSLSREYIPLLSKKTS